MVLYAITLEGIKNNIVGPILKSYENELETIDIDPINNKELTQELYSKYKNNEIFKDCDSVIIRDINLTHNAILKDYNNLEIPENLKNLYLKSKKLWESENIQNIINIQYIKRQYNYCINDIKYLRDQSEKLNLLDSQEYLNFLDSLNKLSIDQDRDDSK